MLWFSVASCTEYRTRKLSRREILVDWCLVHTLEVEENGIILVMCCLIAVNWNSSSNCYHCRRLFSSSLSSSKFLLYPRLLRSFFLLEKNQSIIELLSDVYCSCHHCHRQETYQISLEISWNSPQKSQWNLMKFSLTLQKNKLPIAKSSLSSRGGWGKI